MRPKKLFVLDSNLNITYLYGSNTYKDLEINTNRIAKAFTRTWKQWETNIKSCGYKRMEIMENICKYHTARTSTIYKKLEIMEDK